MCLIMNVNKNKFIAILEIGNRVYHFRKVIITIVKS